MKSPLSSNKQIFLGLVYLQNVEIRKPGWISSIGIILFVLFLFVVKWSFFTVNLILPLPLAGILLGIVGARALYKSVEKYPAVYSALGEKYIELLGKSGIMDMFDPKFHRFWLKETPKVSTKTNLWLLTLLRFILFVPLSVTTWSILYQHDAFKYSYFSGTSLALLPYFSYCFYYAACAVYWKYGISKMIERVYGFTYEQLCVEKITKIEGH